MATTLPTQRRTMAMCSYPRHPRRFLPGHPPERGLPTPSVLVLCIAVLSTLAQGGDPRAPTRKTATRTDAADEIATRDRRGWLDAVYVPGQDAAPLEAGGATDAGAASTVPAPAVTPANGWMNAIHIGLTAKPTTTQDTTNSGTVSPTPMPGTTCECAASKSANECWLKADKSIVGSNYCTLGDGRTPGSTWTWANCVYQEKALLLNCPQQSQQAANAATAGGWSWMDMVHVAGPPSTQAPVVIQPPSTKPDSEGNLAAEAWSGLANKGVTTSSAGPGVSTSSSTSVYTSSSSTQQTVTSLSDQPTVTSLSDQPTETVTTPSPSTSVYTSSSSTTTPSPSTSVYTSSSSTTTPSPSTSVYTSSSSNQPSTSSSSNQPTTSSSSKQSTKEADEETTTSSSNQPTTTSSSNQPTTTSSSNQPTKEADEETTTSSSNQPTATTERADKEADDDNYSVR